MNVLVTGGSGFVGRVLLSHLAAAGHSVSATARNNGDISEQDVQEVIADVTDSASLVSATTGMDVVVHCAGRAHVMREESCNPLEVYRRINTTGTIALANAAIESGVKRFVFISSIKVCGEVTHSSHPFKASDVPCPTDPYSCSKFEAEQALLKLAKVSKMDVVIIRPPLVYGPNVKGNFASMLRWVKAGIPLPLGSIDNKRSLVGVDNLVSLIATCIDHPRAKNEVFLAGDGEDLSTSDLLRRLAKAIHTKPRLIPVPPAWLIFAATLLGKKAVAQRICGYLQVDISKSQSLLGWEPPISVDEGLRRSFENPTVAPH